MTSVPDSASALVADRSVAMTIFDWETARGLTVNRAAHALLGYDAPALQAMVGRDLHADPDSVPAVSRALHERGSHRDTLRILRADGTPIHVDLSLEVIDVGGRRLIVDTYRRSTILRGATWRRNAMRFAASSKRHGREPESSSASRVGSPMTFGGRSRR